jgi:hypothetical protein
MEAMCLQIWLLFGLGCTIALCEWMREPSEPHFGWWYLLAYAVGSLAGPLMIVVGYALWVTDDEK